MLTFNSLAVALLFESMDFLAIILARKTPIVRKPNQDNDIKILIQSSRNNETPSSHAHAILRVVHALSPRPWTLSQKFLTQICDK
jgi:hypothetical protein